ncbi:MAG TPA: 30S ribosomal protein S4 [Candidatus Acidoferrales bacterium]|jgi:small subunit ribosomal protein S4|nr:30S ribosomal protein S4 [Candidatus Acidoferrales bacterium]
MGYPGKSRKMFDKPSHPWQGVRINEEAELVKTYGLKNKREVWKAATTLRKYRREARKLLFDIQEVGERGEHAKFETEKFLGRLKRLGLMKSDSSLDSVLTLGIEDLMDRRLQTQVQKQGLANSVRHARQLIVHGHIAVDGRRVTVPSYILLSAEQDLIEHYEGSPLRRTGEDTQANTGAE